MYAIYLSDAFTLPLSAFSKLKHVVLPAPHPLHHLRAAGLVPQALEGGFPQMFANLQAQWNAAPGAQVHHAPQPPAPLIPLPPPAAQPTTPVPTPAPQTPLQSDPDDDVDPDMLELVVSDIEDGGQQGPEPLGDVILGAEAAPPPPAPGPGPHMHAPFNIAGLPPLPPFLQQIMNAPGVVAVGATNMPFQGFGPGLGVPAGPPPPPQIQPQPQLQPAAGQPPGLPPGFNIAGFPHMLQQLMQAPNVMAVHLHQPGGPAPPNAGNPPPQAPAAAPFPLPFGGWNVGGAILIQGTVAHQLQPQPAPQAPPPQPAAPPNPAAHVNPLPVNPPPVLPVLPPTVNQPPIPPPAEPPLNAGGAHAGAAGIEALGAQIQNTTNAIMNMIAQSQANVTHLQQELMQTQADLAQVQQGLQVLENVAFGGPGGAPGVLPPVAAGLGPMAQLGPLPPQPQMPPINFNTTFIEIGAGDAGDDDAVPPMVHSRHRQTIDPKHEEALDKARRKLKGKERMILDKWKLGGLIPNLKTVTFDMVGYSR